MPASIGASACSGASSCSGAIACSFTIPFFLSFFLSFFPSLACFSFAAFLMPCFSSVTFLSTLSTSPSPSTSLSASVSSPSLSPSSSSSGSSPFSLDAISLAFLATAFSFLESTASSSSSLLCSLLSSSSPSSSFFLPLTLPLIRSLIASFKSTGFMNFVNSSSSKVIPLNISITNSDTSSTPTPLLFLRYVPNSFKVFWQMPPFSTCSERSENSAD